MTVANRPREVARNLLRTYFALGNATPGSTVTQEVGFDLCTGSFDHPICNFAANVNLDPWTANRLAEIALGKQHFNIYSLPGDMPGAREVRDEILARAGFRRIYSLRQMVWEPSPIESQCVPEPAVSTDDRSRVASFMASQFFSRHSSNFRRRVADATVAAEELDLYSLGKRTDPIAAVMVAEDDALIGLFNLCVKPGNQNRGIGASLVSAIQAMAYGKGKPVGLQCEESLVTWYESQGFCANGYVDVYALPDERRIAIID